MPGALSCALGHKMNNDMVGTALTLLYTKLAESYKEVGDAENAQKIGALAAAAVYKPTDKGAVLPWYKSRFANRHFSDSWQGI